MLYKKFGNTYMVRIDLDEEIMPSLKALCEKENIQLARVEALGAVNHAVLGVYDMENRAYQREEIDGFMEITGLTGNVTRMNGEVYIHLHSTMVDQNHTVHAGHALELRVGATCEMFVTVLSGEVDRVRDENMGINLIRL